MELKNCPQCNAPAFGNIGFYIFVHENKLALYCLKCDYSVIVEIAPNEDAAKIEAGKRWNTAPHRSTAELKPCWNCGSSRIWRQSSARDFHYFRCEDCGTCAPDDSTISGAAEMWNAHERKPAPAVESAEWHPDEWRRQYDALQRRAEKAERKLKKAKEKTARRNAEALGERRHAITAEQQLSDARGTIAQLEADLAESQRARLELQEQVQDLEAEIIVKEDERLAAGENGHRYAAKVNRLAAAFRDLIRKVEYAASSDRFEDWQSTHFEGLKAAAEIARAALREND